MESQPYVQDEEIDLSGMIDVLAKRCKLILSVFFLSVFCTAIYNVLLVPKTYEISTTIQIGTFNELLIKKEEAKEIILNRNLLSTIINEFGLKTDEKKLKDNIGVTDIAGTELIIIEFSYPDIDTAFKINDAIISPLITQGQNLFQQRLAIANERLKDFDSEIKYVEADIERTQNLMSGMTASANASPSDVSLRIILLQNTLPNYESNLTTLRNQRNELRLSLVNAKDFKIFDKPIKPKRPISKKIARKVIVAGLLGLIFGIFLAFLLEHFENIKKVSNNKS